MFNGYWLLFLGLIPNFIQLIWAQYTANNLRFQAVSEAAQPVSRAAGVFLSFDDAKVQHLHCGLRITPQLFSILLFFS